MFKIFAQCDRAGLDASKGKKDGDARYFNAYNECYQRLMQMQSSKAGGGSMKKSMNKANKTRKTKSRK
jgi:hypothetical protein